MADPIRIKRRTSGNVGAPSTLLNAEPAYNEVEDVLYIGVGIDGNGNATTIKAIAGAGVFATKAYVTAAVAAVDVSGQLASYLLASTAASTYAPLASPSLTGTPTAPTATSGTNTGQIATTAFVVTALGSYLTSSSAASTYLTQSNAASTYLTQANAATTYATQTALAGYLPTATAASTYLSQSSAASTYAPLASPALTGTPTAPTAAASTNTTQLATTAFVQAAVAALINGSPGALDTLQELAAALGNDPNFASTITTALAGKLAKASNLSDLTSASSARTNLGLGTLATQNANNVAITGGTIDGITLDGGTF